MLELHKQHKKKTSLTKANKSKGFLEQVIINNEELVATFQGISSLLKNMYVHMVKLA
jgi:hypothetical protein